MMCVPPIAESCMYTLVDVVNATRRGTVGGVLSAKGLTHCGVSIVGIRTVGRADPIQDRRTGCASSAIAT